jgi:hypothetical protein
VGKLLAPGLLLIASCGRLGFADQQQLDGGAGDAAAPERLQCGAPTRFQVGAGSFTAIAPTATADGFALFAATGAAVNGWAFVFADGQLVPTVMGVPVATSETSAIGAAASGSTLLLSSMYGSPATGTALVPLDQNLAPLGTIDENGTFAIANPVASGPAGFAFATVDDMTGEIDAQLTSTTALPSGSPVSIVGSAESANQVTIIPTASGYAVAYISSANSPSVVRVELLDGSLGVAVAPADASNSPFGANSVSLAWAPITNLYLATWSDKSDMGNDRAWATLLDASLHTVVPPVMLSASSYSPSVATDGSTFWVTWQSYVDNPAPNFLAAAQVAADGTVTPRAVTGSGGSPGMWAMIERDGQPVLVWTETGGTGGDLYLDPMCAN